MCDAADLRLGQGGSGLGLCLAATRGHHLDPRKFLCARDMENDAAPTNLARDICPPHSSQGVPVHTLVWSSLLRTFHGSRLTRSKTKVLPVTCKVLHDLTQYLPFLSSFHWPPTFGLLQSHWPCCCVNTPGPCLMAFALVVSSAWNLLTLDIVTRLSSLPLFRSFHKFHLCSLPLHLVAQPFSQHF